MKPVIQISIGEYYASRKPEIISTLLGSCVAACLYDPVNMIGGMNHILLPGRADLKHFNDQARYGINAMELLVNRVMTLGGDRRKLTAKIFGGATILPSVSDHYNVGKKISDFVINYLRTENIKLINQNIGGHETRKIFFHIDTGDVFLKRFKKNQHKEITSKEKALFKQIKRKIKKPAKVDIFNSNLPT